MKENKKAVAKKKKVDGLEAELSQEERLEQLYQNAVRVFNSMSCMTMTKSKLDMYDHLKNEFASLEDYKDSKDFVKQCKEQSKEIEKTIIETQYKDYCNRLEIAKSEKDYEELRIGFKELKDYKESVKMSKQCERILATNFKKNKYAVIRKGCIALVLIVIIIFANTRIGKYNISRAFNKLNFYSKSAEMYKNLGSYKDSKKRYQESSYKEAVKLKKAGKLVEAHKIFYDINEYQDSVERLVEIEETVLRDANIGDSVNIGASTWIILDKQEDKVLCIKKKPISNVVYNTNDRNVTWETSQLRNYLNSEYMKEKFCEEEIAKIELTKVTTNDNTKYTTKGGNPTQDKLYILSLEEVLKYESVLENIVTKSSWLRSSGGLQSAVSVYNGKEVNDYGNLATKEHVYAYPMFWYLLK